MSKIYPWPRTVDYFRKEEITKWFDILKQYKLPYTYCWVAESGRIHELREILLELAKVNGSLCILVSPDSMKKADGYADDSFKQSGNDYFWTTEYKKYNGVLFEYRGQVKIELVHFDMEGYVLSNGRNTDFEVRSRMFMWEYLVREHLLKGITFAYESHWYGLGWQVLEINTRGTHTGNHVWGRLPSAPIHDSCGVCYVNMYTQLEIFTNIDATFDTKSPKLFFQWCGVKKHYITAKDTLTSAVDLNAIKAHGKYLNKNIPVIIYGSNYDFASPEHADEAYLRDLHAWLSARYGIAEGEPQKPISAKSAKSVKPRTK